jgi:hypothetical protein
VFDIIALIMTPKSLLQTFFASQCWLKKVRCSYTLAALPFSLCTLEAAGEFKTETKTKVQYNDNNKAKEQTLVKHHLFI